MLRIAWREKRKTDADIQIATGVNIIIKIIRKRQLTTMGQINRRDGIEKLLLSGKVLGKAVKVV